MELEITSDQVSTITGILGSLPTSTNVTPVTFTQAQIDAVQAVLTIMQANLQPELPASDTTDTSA